MLQPVKGHVRSAPTARFVRLAKHRAQYQRQRPRQQPWLISSLSRAQSQSRWQTTAAVSAAEGAQSSVSTPTSLAIQSDARFSDIDVQHLSKYMHEQVFPGIEDEVPRELVELSKEHLSRHDLLGKNTDNSPPISFDLPELQGKSLDEHFHKLGIDSAEPFLTKAKQFAIAEAPSRPKRWLKQSGWTKYTDNEALRVEAPDSDMLCFDVEVLWKASPYAIMACAMSPTAWYVWLSPWLLGESETDKHLIPLGDPTQDRVIVGHNVGYDRGRVLEEYSLEQTRNSFIDTMSLHVAVNGMCSRQRPKWMKHRKNVELRAKIAQETQDADLANLLAGNDLHDEEDELWFERSSINSLRDVAQFHLNLVIDKSIRDEFGELDREGVLAKLDALLEYCAADVKVTHQVYKKVFGSFLEVCPHPVSFAALRHLSSVILPINKSWDEYIEKAEATYNKLSNAVQERLKALAEKALEIKDDKEKWSSDPWLKQLDWSGQEIKMTKGKKGEPPRPAARQKLPGMPKWYKDLFPKRDAPMNLTIRTRITPLLLRLAWDGYPLHWSDNYGWVFRVPLSDAEKYSETQLVRCDFSDDPNEALKNDRGGLYFKLPHKNGPKSRCGTPLAKSYLTYFDKGTLSSEYPYAKEALEMNASCSYWISARDRIMNQLAVYEGGDALKGKSQHKNIDPEQGYILPQVIPMGTITRRAVENTWLTASNAKKNRVGSELKAMVKAPPGYSFVGADVDSEELWIASLVGDATFKLHGGNAIGFMTLEGTKAAGTDLHSRTAAILGISRNEAKIFNYGRIYGAGLNFAATLLRQFNPNLSEQETLDIAGRLYASTKGTKTNRKTLHNRAFWRGGTESFVFNKLEEFAEQDHPRTPVLGAGITQALMAQYISKGGYLTSRINWAIQSSGVDYLHLLIVSMDYLTRRFNINARMAISVHDEIRYLVKDEDKYRAAMALQVSNIWTRAMFAQQVGINDLPQACAFFSAIDIDHVLRKEVDLNCVTPSHPDPIPPGESIDIMQLLDKGEAAYLDPKIVPEKYAPKPKEVEYVPRTPVMETLGAFHDPKDLSFLKAQITNDEEELRAILREQKKIIGDKSNKTMVARPRQTKLTPYNTKPQLMPTFFVPFKANFSKPQISQDAFVFESLPPRNWKRTTGSSV
ncbi:DNA polymerase gamma [Biscogniauxia mediterranea]|nr:DNA polymerase gamma [Biscogniauxia mediterranea]